MKTTEDNFISDTHFDVLLRHALLEKDKMFNEQTQETMANQAFSLVNVAAISESKGETIIEKLTSDFKSGSSRFRLNIFLLSLLTVATITGVIFFTSQKKEIITKVKSTPVVTKDNEKFEPIPTITLDEVNGNPVPRTNPAVLAFLDSTNDEDSTPVQNLNNVPSQSLATTLHIPMDYSLHYEDIPTLNDDQKKQTEKDKLKILKDIATPKKKVYMYIGNGTTRIGDAFVSIASFSIKTAEITNFEYTTFLNDLLIQQKFDDYLLAKPVDGGWKACGIPEFENLYAENPAYNNFPACNMTRKGAELYCEWLTKEFNSAIQNKEIKWSGHSNPEFRLPSNYEWIYAARGCDTGAIQLPWERYIHWGTQNINGCYLCNFNYSISKDKLSKEGPPMFKNNTRGCIAAKMSTRAIVTTAARAIDTLVTAPVYSYNPNTIGLYCTLGNVSEMVWTYDAANPGVQGAARSMGGSWYSHVDNVLFEAPEQYVGVTDARAYIGFRPVMVFK